MESLKDKFHQRPYEDPKSGDPIKINSKAYKKLVEKYGQPKIKSPLTGSKIGVGKGEYNKLIKSGYTEETLFNLKDESSMPIGESLMRLPTDNINEILLRSDINTLRQFCLTNKPIQAKCLTEQFWQDKLKYDGLPAKSGSSMPTILFNKTRNMDLYVDNLEINNKFELWVTLYNTMKKADFEAKGIVLINKVEKAKGYDDTGTFRINFENTYEMEEDNGIEMVKSILSNMMIEVEDYIPKSITISLLKDKYELKYNINMLKKKINLTDMIDEQEVVRILTLFLFDYYTIIGNFDIVDVKGESFMDSAGSDYRRGMWDLLHYQNNK